MYIAAYRKSTWFVRQWGRCSVIWSDELRWCDVLLVGWLVWREWPVLPPWPPASKSVELRLPCSMGGVLFCMTSCQGITSGIYCFFGGHRVATNGKRGTVEPVGTRPCVWCFMASIVLSSKIWHEAGDYNSPRNPKSPFSMASSHHFIHDPSGCNFNAGFGWLNGLGFLIGKWASWGWVKNETQLISLKTYTLASVGVRGGHQMDEPACRDDPGTIAGTSEGGELRGFLKTYQNLMTRSFRGIESRPPFGPRWDSMVSPSLSGSPTALFCPKVAKVAAKISQSSTCELSCHHMSPRNLG